MPRVEGELVIERPVEEVFDFVADERNEPRFNPRMLRAEKISPGPIGLGTRFRAEMGMRGRGRPVVMTVEFTALERPRRLASSTQMATMDIDGTLTFDPVPEGTRALAVGPEAAGPRQTVEPGDRPSGPAAGAGDLVEPQAASRIRRRLPGRARLISIHLLPGEGVRGGSRSACSSRICP